MNAAAVREILGWLVAFALLVVARAIRGERRVRAAERVLIWGALIACQMAAVALLDRCG